MPFSHHRLVPLLLIPCALLCHATVSAAQLSTTRGASFGVHLEGTSLTPKDGKTTSGGGLGLRAGYGFNRIVTGFVELDGSQINVDESGPIFGSWRLAHVEIGARFHFASSLRRWVPYLETSAGTRAVQVHDARVNGQNAGTVTFNGGAFTVGTGLSVYVKPTVALDVSLKLTGGRFTEVDLGDTALQNIKIEANSSRFGVGLIWWP